MFFRYKIIIQRILCPVNNILKNLNIFIPDSVYIFCPIRIGQNMYIRSFLPYYDIFYP